ncbi:MAG: hypothetical protein KDA89_11770 [Planctomycetaceae bacterium]|nr:hypothetical protein [Planctomycetaceae bacterium]
MNTRSAIILCALTLAVGCGTDEPQVVESYIHCRTLSGSRTAVKVFEWEFNAVSEAIKSCCPTDKELTEKEILTETIRQLTPELRDSLSDAEDSIGTVFLELEVRGVFEKTADTKDGEPKYRRTA